MPQLQPLDWIALGAAAVSLYVLTSWWLSAPPAAPSGPDEE
jgi:hypothetical protein